MRLVGQGDSKYLKHFVDAPLQSHIVLYYRNETVSYYGTVDLNTDCILRGSPEPLYPQVLFHPFEEKFDTPSVAVKLRYQQWQASILLVRKMYLVPSSGSRTITLRSSSGYSLELL